MQSDPSLAAGADVPNGPPAIGYASAPADLPLDGPEIKDQVVVIQSACEELGLALGGIVREHELSGSDGRPGLHYALERLDAGEGSCLVVSELERLTREVTELARVVDRLERGQIRLVAIDVGLDTATPSGRLAVSLPGADGQEASSAGAKAEPPPVPPEARRTESALRALGYASAPADGQDSEDLDAQRQAIEGRASALGLRLIEVVREREPEKGKALDRPGLSYLIERIAAGDASCLVIPGLDRLSRSVAELGTIVQWLERNEVRLLAIDLDLDTAEPAGRTTARALASVAGSERDRLSKRTRKGLAAARSKRRAAANAPAVADWSAVRKRIATMRADGLTLQAIADALNEEGVPTPRGGAKWRPSSVQTAAGYKRRARSKDVEDLPQVAGKAQDAATKDEAGAET